MFLLAGLKVAKLTNALIAAKNEPQKETSQLLFVTFGNPNC